ncbi:AtpZ/AtpI family protein [Faecalibacter rhinopitheci]|uniref:AtpZ/AtpI family protein n=1 Tax=Faecalibacter rhinopitheci TaxID=2779678 RepID=A0A8J7KI39_9FLAO|nr:AtpZ/AtpI family protein [Faecalibacter rhinopitheci]MBF0597081.1 AtpZ/AtpI family protein [Faecalibacter rhinopitheci]MBQ0148900.1 AtpZ/AtpI family protein [Candidatus Onthonaster equi]
MKQEPKTKNVNNYLKFSAMGIQMALTIAIFAGIGYWLDQKYQTKQPYWTAALSLFGVFGGIYSVIRQLPKD